MGKDDASTGKAGEKLAERITNFRKLNSSLKNELLKHIVPQAQRAVIHYQLIIEGEEVEKTARQKIDSRTFDGVYYQMFPIQNPTAGQLIQAWNDGQINLAEVKSTRALGFPTGSPTIPQLRLEKMFRTRYTFIAAWVTTEKVKVLTYDEMQKHRRRLRIQCHASENGPVQNPDN
jgi:hypothetical protein